MHKNHEMMASNSTLFSVRCYTWITHKQRDYRYHVSNTHRMHYHISAYINCCLTGPTAILNLSVLIVLLKSRALWSRSNIPLAFLAGWDMLTALLSQPVFAVYLFQLVQLKLSCGLIITVSYVAAIIAMTSSLIVVVISTERYFALFHVFFWSGRITHQKLIIPLCLIWVVPLVICVIMFDFMPIAGISIYTLVNIVAITWISICYYRMFKLIRKLQKRVMPRDTANQLVNDKRGKQARLTKFTSAIVALYLVMNIPYCLILVLISTVFKDDYYADPIKWYSATWLMLNSLLNPIVYAWQSPHIGRGLLRLWRFPRTFAIESTSNKENAEGTNRIQMMEKEERQQKRRAVPVEHVF